MSDSEKLLSRRTFVKAAVTTGTLGVGLLGDGLRASPPATTSKLYSLEEVDGKLRLKKPGTDVTGLTDHKWKLIIPVPPSETAGDDAPRDLVAFATSDPKVKYFKNDGGGAFTGHDWMLPAGFPAIAKLELGRNICTGRFSGGGSIDLLVQQEFSGAAAAPTRRFTVWQISPTGITGPVKDFMTDFPFIDYGGPPRLQHIAAGRFFPSKDWPLDDLLFYQGNNGGGSDKGVLQLHRFGIGVTSNRQVKFRSTLSSVLPCPGLFPPKAGVDAKLLPTHLFLFDDGSIVRNHRGRRFEKHPYSGWNPMAPWAELRRPTLNGHLVLVNRDPQPDPTEGPPVRETGTPKKRVANRGVIATPTPRLDHHRMLRLDAGVDTGPDNLHFWTLNGHDPETQFIYLRQFPYGGYFLQALLRVKEVDNYFYRVLDKNLKLSSPTVDDELPHKLKNGVMIIPGRFLADTDKEDLLFYLP